MTTKEQASFFRAIIKDPKYKLIYADWLEDHGLEPQIIDDIRYMTWDRWNPPLLHELIGTRIIRFCINDDELIIVTDYGEFGYEVYGDCCSESWFSDINGLHEILGQEIFDVESIDLKDYNTDDGRGRQDVDEVYCYRLNKVCSIIFRNSSNGYYGGSLDRMKSINYVTLYKEIKVNDWRN